MELSCGILFVAIDRFSQRIVAKVHKLPDQQAILLSNLAWSSLEICGRDRISGMEAFVRNA